MNDYLNLDDGSDGSGGDFLSGGDGYLGLDEPAHPTAPPPPPSAPVSHGSGGEYMDAGGFGGDGDWLGGSDSSASSGGSWMDAPSDMSADAGGWMDSGSTMTEQAAPPVAAPAVMSAPAAANPMMQELSVQAPYLEDVHRTNITVGGTRGELSNLVMDVEVPVEVYFGDAQLTVEEFLEMGAGSVVELDHAIDAPIELRVRGKLVARGQLVTINGNYGLRITDMVEGINR